jgi:hypothetical protein
MSMIESTMFYTVMSVVSALVMLSIATQILQELYKFLTDSKSRAYMRALGEFIGPLALKLPFVDDGTNLLVSGPFQVKRFRTTGKFQPLAKEVLISRIEQTAPPWIRRAQKCLEREAIMQDKTPAAPSPDLKEFLEDLAKVLKAKGAEGYWNAHELDKWLEPWHLQPSNEKKSETSGKSMESGQVSSKANKAHEIDAAKMLISFREKFLPHVNAAERNFAQLNTNFEHINRRRNLRLTFLLSLVMILPLDFSLTTLFKNARRMSPQEAMALAQTATGMYQKFIGQGASAGNKENAIASAPAGNDQAGIEEENAATENFPDTDLTKDEADKKIKEDMKNLEKLLTQLSRTKDVMDSYSQEAEAGLQWVGRERIIGHGVGFWSKLWNLLLYLFQCALTAVAVCFGAPFWNDIAKTMLRRATPSSEQAQS